MSSHLFKVVLSVMLLVAIGCGGGDEDKGESKTQPSSGSSAAKEDKSGMSAVGSLTETLSQASGMIDNVKNPQTAQLAAQQIEQMAGSINPDVLSKLPGPAKMAAGEVIRTFREGVETALEKVYEMDGVEAVLKPSVDGLMNKLDGLAE